MQKETRMKARITAFFGFRVHAQINCQYYVTCVNGFIQNAKARPAIYTANRRAIKFSPPKASCLVSETKIV